jgi:AraC-like DNA-binding protein
MQTLRNQENYVPGLSPLSFIGSQHPEVRIIELAEENMQLSSKSLAGWFCIIISPQQHMGGKLQFKGPGTFTGMNAEPLAVPSSGQALLFQSGLIQSSAVADYFNDFKLFASYSNTPLNLSPREYRLALDCFSNIRSELNYSMDKHSRRLIVSNLELFLNYCERFLSEQGAEQKNYQSVLHRFDKLLSRYFSSENPFKIGIPSVAYFADGVHLSAKYFGSLVKKETGKTAQEYIRDKIIEEAQCRITCSFQSINDIAYDLGFKYPQHFCRFFKKVIGVTPNEYRHMQKQTWDQAALRYEEQTA